MDKVIFTAIFGPYDELKDPWVITPGWRYVCFTDQPVTSKYWEIQNPHDEVFTNQGKARLIKLMFHKFVSDDLSIWVDGSFTINCNLDNFVAKNHKGQFSAPKHPWRNDVFDEAQVCISQNRADKMEVITQMNQYLNVVPRHNGLIQSGILIRSRTPEVKALCEEWWKELMKGSIRDQIAFAKASIGHENIINTYDFDYTKSKEFIFTRHL
jgi:hypothetical protein